MINLNPIYRFDKWLRHGAIRKQDDDWPPRCRIAASCVPEPLGWYS